jgi:hypothetical protein
VQLFADASTFLGTPQESLIRLLQMKLFCCERYSSIFGYAASSGNPVQSKLGKLAKNLIKALQRIKKHFKEIDWTGRVKVIFPCNEIPDFVNYNASEL